MHSIVKQTRTSTAVLVAEDDPNDGLLLQMAFNKASVGSDLHFVPDGRAAMDYLEGAPPYEDRLAHPFPKLLLLDLKMPRVNGFEVLDWLGQREEFPELFVVVFSGSDSPGDITLAYALGADACLPKPCDPGRFTSVVSGLAGYYLSGSRVRRRRPLPRQVWSENLFALASRLMPLSRSVERAPNGA